MKRSVRVIFLGAAFSVVVLALAAWCVLSAPPRPVLGMLAERNELIPSWRPYAFRDVDNNRIYLDADRNFAVLLLSASGQLTDDGDPSITSDRATFFPNSATPVVLTDCTDSLVVIDQRRLASRFRVNAGEVTAWINGRALLEPAQWDTSRTLRDTLRAVYTGPDRATLLQTLGPEPRPFSDRSSPHSE